MLLRLSNPRKIEIWLGFALLTQLQWFFGNLYEEILTPNSIGASTQALDAYNSFFRYTEPYYYYIPLTQLGALVICGLAFHGNVPEEIRAMLRRAAAFGSAAVLSTIFIVMHYNLHMFFGPVDHLGDSVHRLYLEWAIWNAVRIALVAVEVSFAIRAYRLTMQLRFYNNQER